MTFDEAIQFAKDCCEPFEVRDVIEQLQEQNAKLKAVVKEKNEVIDNQKAEIERYKRVIKILEKDVESSRVEAYREFAKFLIDKSENGFISIDNLPEYVIEMEGKSE